VPRWRQLRELGGFAGWNLGRVAVGRFRRYGLAAVTIGRPVPLADWFAAEGGDALFARERHERLARVQGLADDVMARIGQLIPVTPVPLVCAALQSLDGDFVSRERLLGRCEALRDVLRELNARGLGDDADVAAGIANAIGLLELRRVLARSGDGWALLPRGRELVSYYANSIAHLTGEFEAGIRARDALPVELVTAGA
jgi:glycerol-3-phosphate O-acyltransferase